jgi:MFS family permease
MDKLSAKNSFLIIFLFGLISLFGDIIYESARSINGPYLQFLGANAFIVGVVVGLSEFLGYALRVVFGYISDKTKSYWLFVIIGYGALLSVPLLALANTWQIAAIFIIFERIGKAIRTPARDTLISYAAKNIGTGWGFAIHEFLDQIGAILGSFLFALIFSNLFLNFGNDLLLQYHFAYSILFIPFIFLLLILFVAFYFYNKTYQNLRLKITNKKISFESSFVYYLLFSFLTTAGFISFVLIAYHFKVKNIFLEPQIPLLYAFVMGIDAFFALFIGKSYDFLKSKFKKQRAGLYLLLILPLLTILIPFTIFSNDFGLIFFGLFLLGTVLGAHETIMKSAIADIIPQNSLGTAYGIFTSVYGFASLIGAIVIGYLYEYSPSLLFFFVVITQIFALAIFSKLKFS